LSSVSLLHWHISSRALHRRPGAPFKPSVGLSGIAMNPLGFPPVPKCFNDFYQSGQSHYIVYLLFPKATRRKLDINKEVIDVFRRSGKRSAIFQRYH
jgi:hypothetical protein